MLKAVNFKGVPTHEAEKRLEHFQNIHQLINNAVAHFNKSNSTQVRKIFLKACKSSSKSKSYFSKFSN